MTLDALIILAGTLVAMLPFAGFPNSWDTVIFFFLGLLVIGLGIVVRRRTDDLKPPVRRSNEFIEHAPETDED